MNNELNKKSDIEEVTSKLVKTNMKTIREFEKKLEDFSEDEGDWFSATCSRPGYLVAWCLPCLAYVLYQRWMGQTV